MLKYFHTKKAIKQKMANLIAEGELLSENSDDEQTLYPVVLGYKASFELYEEQIRINNHLTNVFTGTSNEKVVGDIELLVEKPKKKEKKDDKEKEGDKEKEKEVKKKKSDTS